MGDEKEEIRRLEKEIEDLESKLFNYIMWIEHVWRFFLKFQSSATCSLNA